MNSKVVVKKVDNGYIIEVEPMYNDMGTSYRISETYVAESKIKMQRLVFSLLEKESK